ncbi:hypothetical protein [Bradyrhizobium sp. USDA 4454]
MCVLALWLDFPLSWRRCLSALDYLLDDLGKDLSIFSSRLDSLDRGRRRIITCDVFIYRDCLGGIEHNQVRQLFHRLYADSWSDTVRPLGLGGVREESIQEEQQPEQRSADVQEVSRHWHGSLHPPLHVADAWIRAAPNAYRQLNRFEAWVVGSYFPHLGTLDL